MLHSRGICKPAKDIAFQEYLLGARPHYDAATLFPTLATTHRYHDGTLQWLNLGKWLPYPSPASGILLMKHYHLTHCNVGA